MWSYYKSNNHDNRNKPVQIFIASHLPDAVKFLHVIYLKPFITPRKRDTDQVLFKMRGNGSLGYRSRNTSHYTPTIVLTTMQVMKVKVLKCIWVRKVMDTGLLIPDNFPLIIVEVVKVVDTIYKRPSNLPQVIAEVMYLGEL